MYEASSDVDLYTIATIMKLRTGTPTRDFNMGEILAGIGAISRSKIFLQGERDAPLEVFDLAMDLIEYKNNKHKQVHPLFYLSDVAVPVSSDTREKLTTTLKRDFRSTFKVNIMNAGGCRHALSVRTLEDWYCAISVVYTTSMLMGAMDPWVGIASVPDNDWYLKLHPTTKGKNT